MSEPDTVRHGTPTPGARVVATPVTRHPLASVIAPWLVCLALFATLAAIAIGATADPGFGMDLSTAGFLLLVGTWALMQSTVGTAIAWRRPGNRVGRLMQATGPLILSVFLGYIVGAIRYLWAGPTDLAGGLAAWWASLLILPVIFLAFPALGLFFPDGHLPSERFRRPLAGLAVAISLVSLANAFDRGPLNEGLPDNPLGVVDLPPEFLGVTGLLGPLALVGGMGIAIAAVAVRWRRGAALERAQLKWLLAPLSLGVVSFGFAFGSSATDVADLVSFVAALLVPTSVGIAVLRYRLYDIDRLISRSVSWALVTALLVAIFAGMVVGLQAVLSSVTQGQALAVAGSTLVAVALFQPLRRRIQAAVDRRFDRARYNARRLADGFAESVRSEVDLTTLRLDLAQTTDRAVRPLTVGVWLRGGAR